MRGVCVRVCACTHKMETTLLGKNMVESYKRRKEQK